MERDCDRCGDSYEAKRSTSKFCSPRCRKQSSRHPEPAAGQPDPVRVLLDSFESASVFSATQVELREAGSLGSALGQAALRLALLIDMQGPLSGSAAASLTKEWRVTLEAAVKAKAAPVSLIDELRKRREQRSAS
jgi:hypothetical protein